MSDVSTASSCSHLFNMARVVEILCRELPEDLPVSFAQASRSCSVSIVHLGAPSWLPIFASGRPVGFLRVRLSVVRVNGFSATWQPLQGWLLEP